MRLAYIDVNVLYMNPTANLMPILMQEVCNDISYYGPGFTSKKELEHGILKWYEKNGPFDVIFLGGWIPVFVDEPEVSAQVTVNAIKHSTARNFKSEDVLPFFQDIQDNLNKIDVPVKIISGLSFDYYAATQKQIDNLNEAELSILAPNHQFMRRLEDLPNFAKLEKHYVAKKQRLSDAWLNFALENPERFVTAVHYISPSEISFEPLQERRHVVAVPGVSYYLRDKAMKQLRELGIKATPRTYYNLYRIANRIGLPVFTSNLSLKLFNQFFFRTLATSRFVYTAPGGFGIPIRKFFEIPAAGALLVCIPCLGYEALGFNAGKHYVESTPEDLPNIIGNLLDDPDVQEIADAGRKLVASKHTLQARALQIRECLEVMLASNYKGASWKNGEFVVEQNQ